MWMNNTGSTVKITLAGYVPDTAATGQATNQMTLQFRNKGSAGAGTTGITDIKTYSSGIDLVAFDEDTLTLSTTAADLLVAAGEVVALNKAENANGDELPAGIATLKYEHV